MPAMDCIALPHTRSSAFLLATEYRLLTTFIWQATCHPLAAALLKYSSVARNCWPILAKGRPCCSAWTQAFKPAASACRCNITS